MANGHPGLRPGRPLERSNSTARPDPARRGASRSLGGRRWRPHCFSCTGAAEASDDEVARDPDRLRRTSGPSSGAGSAAWPRPARRRPAAGRRGGGRLPVLRQRLRRRDQGVRGRRRTPAGAGDPADAAAQDDAALVDTKAATLLDAAPRSASTRRGTVLRGPGARRPRRGPAAGQELGWGDALRLPVLRSALQFVSRKTGAPTLIIERFLDDVAYYLEMPEMRESVLGIVDSGLRRAVPDGGDVVVLGHSLGSIVAYDALTRLPDRYRVRLLVTAGSPLGYPIVQKNLLGKQPGHRRRCRPRCRARPAAGSTPTTSWTRRAGPPARRRVRDGGRRAAGDEPPTTRRARTRSRTTCPTRTSPGPIGRALAAEATELGGPLGAAASRSSRPAWVGPPAGRPALAMRSAWPARARAGAAHRLGREAPDGITSRASRRGLPCNRHFDRAAGLAVFLVEAWQRPSWRLRARPVPCLLEARALRPTTCITAPEWASGEDGRRAGPGRTRRLRAPDRATTTRIRSRGRIAVVLHAPCRRVCPRSDSNRHCDPFKGPASAGWATGAGLGR